MEQYEKLLAAALGNLYEASRAMMAQTKPKTPLPRPKIIYITTTITYPRIIDAERVQWRSIKRTDGGGYKDYERLEYSSEAATLIMDNCKYQPRLILRALRQIRAATAWCEARTEGRKRAAEEILRQQAAAMEALDAEAAMAAMSK